jgi:hypothetical protein
MWRTSPPCTPWLPGGPRKDGKSTELAERYACSGWRSLIGKTRSPPSFVAPLTRPRLTNEPGANGLALCDTRQSTNRIPIRSISSSSARVASTRAPLGSLGVWGEVLRLEKQVKRWPPRSNRHRARALRSGIERVKLTGSERIRWVQSCKNGTLRWDCARGKDCSRHAQITIVLNEQCTTGSEAASMSLGNQL